MAKKRARKTLFEPTQPQSATNHALGGPLHSKNARRRELLLGEQHCKDERGNAARAHVTKRAFNHVAARNTRWRKAIQGGKTHNEKAAGWKRRWTQTKRNSRDEVASACAHAEEQKLICPRNLAARPRCRGCRAASQESCSARDCARLLGTRREAKAAREMLPRMHAKHQASERPDSSPVGLRVGTRLETFTEEQKAHEKGIGGGTAGGKVRPACADGAIGTRQGTPAARPRGCVGRVPRRGEAATRGGPAALPWGERAAKRREGDRSGGPASSARPPC